MVAVGGEDVGSLTCHASSGGRLVREFTVCSFYYTLRSKYSLGLLTNIGSAVEIFVCWVLC